MPYFNSELLYKQINSFNVAHTHGWNSFRELGKAYQYKQQWEYYDEICRNESRQDVFQNAGVNLSRCDAAGTELFGTLSACAILFQGAMEAMFAHVILENIGSSVEGSFANKWKQTLEGFGQSTDEFEKYKDEFYNEIRIPLTHPDTEDKLSKIGKITFQSVYCGIRYGWWAQSRLLCGVGLVSNDHLQSWQIICDGVDFPHDLYREKMPV